MVEILGIVATALVLVSFLFKNLTAVRYVNIIACIVFVIYGILLHAWSVWIGNIIIALVHVVYLIRGRRK